MIQVTLSEYGILHNLSDEELVKMAWEDFRMVEEEVYLLLDIERGGTGDVIEI